MSPPDSRRLIAVISNQFAAFQKPIVAQLAVRLRERGYGIVCVAGGALEPEPEGENISARTRNAIYDVATRYPVVGYIVLSVTIGNHALEQQVIDLVRRFAHKPLVSFGVDIPSVSSVVVDNEKGMTALVEHMTQDAKRKRFAFIRGYPNMTDSMQREHAFRQTLQRRGIAVNENLIVDGNFMSADSFYAMDELLRNTHDIDAVIAASDPMALSAIHALNKHGLKVPEDVAVCGFDNGPAATESLPPLTTFSYPLSACIEATVDRIVEQIESPETAAENSKQARTLSGELIIRLSSDKSSDPTHLPTGHDANVFNALTFRNQLQHNLETLRAPEGLSVNHVVDDVVAMLVNGTAHSGNRLNAALKDLRKRPKEIDWWRHLHHQIGTTLQQHGNVGQSPQALSLISTILTRVQESVWTVEAEQRFGELRFVEVQLRLRRKLAATTSFDGIEKTLLAAAAKIGLRAAFVCLYTKPGIQPGTKATLACCYPVGIIPYSPTQEFPAQEILPNNLDHPLEINPLCTGNMHFGYLVIDTYGVEFMDTTSLADNISNAVCNCMQIQPMNRVLSPA